jgi:4-aminobutyrate aminotransferase-like enzyme/Ser/Thr protein kinase RdoA (MazF antagonist)
MYSALKISTQKAEELALEHFNLKGKATALIGEIDLNFKIEINNTEGYILKISRPNEDCDYLDFQQQLLQYVSENDCHTVAPKVVMASNGKAIISFLDESGHIRQVRLLTWISGRIWSSVNPQLPELRYSLGEQCGKLTQALAGFDHEKAHRKFVWDIAQSDWTKEYLHLFEKEEKQIIHYFQNAFEQHQSSYEKLRKSVVHNDANDNNIIVSEDLLQPRVKATIDYGDAIYTQIINDVAITCVYAIMNHNDPLEAALPILKGYHKVFPLQESELEHLYGAIAMRLAISVTKSAVNKIEEPNNAYLQISEKPAWLLLKKWREISPDFAYFSFRGACGFTAHPNEEKFKNWATKQTLEVSNLFPSIKKNNIEKLDLSVGSTWVGHIKDMNNLDFFQFKIDQLQAQQPDKLIAGGYLEARSLYTSNAYDKIGNYGRESRTVHLGIDFWLPAKTPVHALFDGEVVVSVIDEGNKAYGGLIILKHHTSTFDFYTLYGHLSEKSIAEKQVGQVLKKADCVGFLGNDKENGNWAPHLHFQMMLSLLDYKNDFLGVAYFNQIEVWKSVCPDPNSLFKSHILAENQQITNQEIIDYRKQYLGKGMSLQYKVPINIVRGSEQYLIDQFGRKYLDTVNNVAHVGHENYDVVKAGQAQMAVLNTNSRYLHENINLLAKELLETLPPELSVLHFVNSGSEANELAIRMATTFTGEKDVIASEVGYHGNTNMCVAISSYKFDGKGGSGVPEHTHIFALPDAFRGKYRGENTGELYAREVQEQIDVVHSNNKGIAAFIIEPIISCGGQIELPEGFLAKAYKAIRAAGGLCISDEVQVGCGRMGKTFWGFQLHNVIPDIISIGKPLGNGHPLAAVACTLEVAEKFANGMEFFNTFGGNPVSCAIGTAVLKTIKNEKLQEHALEVGNYLKDELSELAKDFSIIGDVRGQGLFLGIELVDANMGPLAAKTDYLANRMKDFGILMSTDGPDHNVLKIKPPMVFTKENADELLFYLRKVFGEDFMS